MFPGVPDVPSRTASRQARRTARSSTGPSTMAKRRNPGTEASVFEFSARHPALQISAGHGRGGHRRARAFRDEVPAVHRARSWPRGWRTRRSTSSTGSSRSTRSAASRSTSASTRREFHRTNEHNRQTLAAHDAGLVHARHQARRGYPREGRRALRNARRMAARAAFLEHRSTRKHKSAVDGEPQAPDANEEYLIYQILLGTWPMESAPGERHGGGEIVLRGDDARGSRDLRPAHPGIYDQGHQGGEGQQLVDSTQRRSGTRRWGNSSPRCSSVGRRRIRSCRRSCRWPRGSRGWG